MSTHTTLDLDALKHATQNGGAAAGLADYITDDIEFTQTDQRTPPGSKPSSTRCSRCATARSPAGQASKHGTSVTADDGSKGPDVGLCTLITNTELLCHSEVILPRGQIAFQGVLHQHDSTPPAP